VSCASSAPVLQLANPGPGDVLSQGDYIVSGVAFDPTVTQGIGIDRVDLFLGQRDSGGVFLGEATLGQDQGNPRGFQVKVKLPDGTNGGRDFVAYAVSSATGEQTSESVPVFVGAVPTATPITSNAPTPIPLSVTTHSTCGSSPRAASTRGQQPTTVAPVANVAPVLDLANPHPGDVLPNGDVIIDGVAFDPSATQGTGIDRVDLFLDNRDEGGLPLGSGSPADTHAFQIKATLPNTANGGHNLFAYAHSSITGQETVQQVPVFIGAAPTPTPRPK
jgi:hypothetical protein